MKNITFITTGQPTTNPRLVKEVETLINLGYNVKVICCFYQLWANEFDDTILKKNPGVYIFCGGDPVKNKSVYYFTRIRQKLCTKLFFFTKTLNIPENAISRTHNEAMCVAKKTKTDLFIAHNIGALPVAVKAAKLKKVKVGYDAEDLHSGLEDHQSEASVLNRYIEQKYFPFTDYFTAASPLIAETYKGIYQYLNPITINNVFEKSNLQPGSKVHNHSTIKLFWFSQTIGINRGLEDIIEALSKINDLSFELHLLGKISDPGFEKYLTNQKSISIFIYNPIASDSITAFAAQFDIGLALEPAFSLNNNLALSNKIFTYIQAGLAVIASDTSAQKGFLNAYPAVGKVYEKGNIDGLVSLLLHYQKNPEELLETQNKILYLANTELNWENESKKFVRLVTNILSD